jgi:hypothetical protein
MTRKNNFKQAVIDTIAKRASYICSNPDCKCITVAPSSIDEEKFLFNGEAAHITAASQGGPRYDANLSDDERASIGNAIYLCANCATIIDKNNGADYSVVTLKEWKADHEAWVFGNLNKSIDNRIFTVDGEHHAEGDGNIVALDIREPAFLKPGTVSTAKGTGNVTATKIGG